MFHKSIWIVAFIFGVLSVGSQTAWSQQRVSPGRGAVPPANLDALVNAQRDVTRVANVLLQSSPRPPRPTCLADMPAFDWRAFNKVSTIQNQGACGDCWAFAAIAAFESSDLIENGGVAGNPAMGDASEKEALDCAEPRYSCAGGWHDKVFDYFVNPNEATRAGYGPYNETKEACRTGITHTNRALHWDFVNGATIPARPDLKKAICEHGPVVAAVSSIGWDARLPDGNFAYSATLNPNWTSDFPNGVYKPATPSTPGLDMAALRLNPTLIDHDVLIVGWDDSLNVWIIKNSWGADFGDHGFMKLPYDTNNLGFNAAWVLADRRSAPLSPSVRDAIALVNRNFKASLNLGNVQ